MSASCPNCGGDLYRGSHRGTQAYKCQSANDCPLSKTPIGRNKGEVERVNVQWPGGSAVQKTYSETFQNQPYLGDISSHVSWMMSDALDDLEPPVEISVTVEVEEQ